LPFFSARRTFPYGRPQVNGAHAALPRIDQTKTTRDTPTGGWPVTKVRDSSSAARIKREVKGEGDFCGRGRDFAEKVSSVEKDMSKTGCRSFAAEIDGASAESPA
jgi:hypothetical protein